MQKVFSTFLQQIFDVLTGLVPSAIWRMFSGKRARKGESDVEMDSSEEEFVTEFYGKVDRLLDAKAPDELSDWEKQRKRWRQCLPFWTKDSQRIKMRRRAMQLDFFTVEKYISSKEDFPKAIPLISVVETLSQIWGESSDDDDFGIDPQAALEAYHNYRQMNSESIEGAEGEGEGEGYEEGEMDRGEGEGEGGEGDELTPADFERLKKMGQSLEGTGGGLGEWEGSEDEGEERDSL
eukprot:CAMPEP_0113890740 /NCGR_PEP_ID=MMETSP0780_2-20120614/14326_1 /TAXON_ID=652834 /ORGANISM="Palpitomonas bilix" /LENGTH=235 /DNA_ID=CAMNT_0000880195 /DNA_START=90 /DNA_END=794 /DNA_ORIENTATION=- /assembly_acc=CAM_ASM_000599